MRGWNARIGSIFLFSLIADTALIFHCRGDYYSLISGEASALAPGKSPIGTLQSTLVMKNGQPNQ